MPTQSHAHNKPRLLPTGQENVFIWRHVIQVPYIWLRSIGKSGIKRKIRKWISPPRNLSSGWISIKKSKSGFRGFPFYHSIGKSEKGFAKLFSLTAVFFLTRARARNRCSKGQFFISQSNGKKEIQKQISQRLNPFSDFTFDYKSEIRILKYKSRFPNRTHPLCPRTMKRWLFWCAKPFLWEMSIFAIQNFLLFQ